MITADKLRELLNYDPDTGVFTWKESRGGVVAGSVAGSPHPRGYISIKIDGQILLAHRLAWLYVYGVWPDVLIDHENEIKTDNRIENLRLATHAQNQHNRSGASKNSRTGVPGVGFHKATGRYRARITVNGNQRTIGEFDTLEQARAARVTAKKVLHPFWTPTET